MTATMIRNTVEATAEVYAALALHKKTIEAQMGKLKRLLVEGIGVGEELVGDFYIISIAPGATTRIWTHPEDKDRLEKALIAKGLLKLETGQPYPVIRLQGDSTLIHQ
jgi:hypothetical protein